MVAFLNSVCRYSPTLSRVPDQERCALFLEESKWIRSSEKDGKVSQLQPQREVGEMAGESCYFESMNDREYSPLDSSAIHPGQKKL